MIDGPTPADALGAGGTTLLRRIDMRGASLSPSHLRSALPRGGTDVDAVLPTVRPVVEAVRDRGA